MPYSARMRRSGKRTTVAMPVTIAALLLVFLIGAALYATGRLPYVHHKTAAPQTSGSAYTKGETSNAGQPSSKSEPNDYSQEKGRDNTGNSTALAIPTGTFASNHHPHLSNNPAGSGYLASNCTTTPGATCTITFRNNDVTIALPVETTDAGGSAYWNNWRPQDYGLTVGSWKIQAVAKLGDQTKTADDALTLEVAQ